MNSRIVKIAVAALVMYGLSFGQWTRSGTNTYLSNTGDKVGIGTTAPSTKLEIYSTATTGDLILKLNQNSTTKLWTGLSINRANSEKWFLGMGNTNENLLFRRNASANDMVLTTTGNLGIGTSTVGSKAQVSGNMAIGYSASTAAPANGLCVSGSVGIGTTTTGTCKLAVAGKIAAREVIVTLATTWPDYVFSSEYKLPSLDAVEKQIKEHGHLENIPPAADIRKNGISVGDMQARIMQKLEENTLYLIAMKKENEELRQKVVTLETKLAGK